VELEHVQRQCGCRGRLRALSRLRSAVAYEGPIEHAVRRLKYDGWRRVALPLSLLLAERLVIEGIAADWVLAVPLHPARLRQRGFNQAELIVRALGKRLALGRPPGELVRKRPTPPQVGHDRLWRLENVRDAFAWCGEDLAGHPLLLVDDVATTGATLDACAAALKAGGAGPVIGASVARVTV
jgi:predicted amidophosphoribosyltransferase